jgi:hypothetical protein
MRFLADVEGGNGGHVNLKTDYIIYIEEGTDI